MTTIAIDSNIYKGAEMYAKLHNISVEHLVETLLKKLQTVSVKSQTSVESVESYLDALDENLMCETFEMAHQDYLDGHFISNSQVVDYIKGELGWK